jgi:hypothetical protein
MNEHKVSKDQLAQLCPPGYRLVECATEKWQKGDLWFNTHHCRWRMDEDGSGWGGYLIARKIEQAVRWWFLPPREGQPARVESLPADRDILSLDTWLEVTPDYAAYLQAKPEGDYELRKVKEGDMFVSMEFLKWKEARSSFANCSANDRGYRWCKVRQADPESPWREYEVKEFFGRDTVFNSDGDRIITLQEAVERPDLLGRFGGVRFKRQSDDLWRTDIRQLIEPDGTLWRLSAAPHAIPAIPIRARFWVGGAQ